MALPAEPAGLFDDWDVFLDDWERELRAALAAPCLGHVRSDIAGRDSLRYPPASEEEIAALEARLGDRLPPTYKEFLRASNGWFQVAMDAESGRFWSTGEVQWFRDQAPWWIQSWTEGIPEIQVPDDQYYVYGRSQDPVHMRPQYLHSALAISEDVDAAVYLLNPAVRSASGEWEAWYFGNELPGANRYRSFRELMAAERQRILEGIRLSAKLCH